MLHRSCNTPACSQPPPAGSTVVPPTSGRQGGGSAEWQDKLLGFTRSSLQQQQPNINLQYMLPLSLHLPFSLTPPLPHLPSSSTLTPPSTSSLTPPLPHLTSLIHSHPPPSAGLLLSGRTSVSPQTSPFPSTPQQPLQHTCLPNSRSHPPCGPTNSKHHDIQTTTTTTITEMTATTQQQQH